MNKTLAGPPQASSPRGTCCGHVKRDHSDRRDHKPSRVVPRRPWCHACSAPCDYEGGNDA